MLKVVLSKYYLLSTLFFAGAVNCQIGLQNKSLWDIEEKVLYPEVENHIWFKSDLDSNIYDYEVLSEQGIVINNIKKKSFIIILKGPFDRFEDTLFVKHKYSDSILNYEIFKIKPLGLIRAQLGSITDSIITSKLICENTYLKLVHEGSSYIPDAKIESFELDIFNSDGKLSKSFGKEGGFQLSKKQIRSVKKMRPGSSILFRNIIIKSNDSPPRVISTLKYWR